VLLGILVLATACDGSIGLEPVGAEPASIPDLVGHQRADALSALRELGIDPVVKRRWTSTGRAGEVIRQRPRGGAELEEGGHVVLVVARPLVNVPDVLSYSRERARRTLRARGFRVKIVERAGGGFLDEFIDPGHVIWTRPEGFAAKRPGTLVVVAVKENPGPCHPAYSGCVPYASDVDCAGGGGDGPVWVDGPVYLTGSSDPYGLDGYDNDGRGCE
jgi:beta-lactam-binding protein with PASTA domain